MRDIIHNMHATQEWLKLCQSNYFDAGAGVLTGAGALGIVFPAAFSTLIDCTASVLPDDNVKLVTNTNTNMAIENPQVNCSTRSPVFWTPNICVAPDDENSPLIPPPFGFWTKINTINKAEKRTIKEINKVNIDYSWVNIFDNSEIRVAK